MKPSHKTGCLLCIMAKSRLDRCILLLVLVVGGIAFASPIDAQQRRIVVEPLPVIPEQDPPDEEANDAFPMPGALPRMSRQQMEEMLYGSLGGSKVAFHKLRRESIRRQLDRVDSVCGFTESQWLKLNEAIEVDIQQIETKIANLMSSFEAKMTPQRLQEMQQKFWQFANQVNNEKEVDGVWRKVLRSQLTKEQTVKVEADKEILAANLMRTERHKVYLMLQRRLGLSASQRREIEAHVESFNATDRIVSDPLARKKTPLEIGQRLMGFVQRSPEVASILSPEQRIALSSMKAPLPPLGFSELERIRVLPARPIEVMDVIR